MRLTKRIIKGAVDHYAPFLGVAHWDVHIFWGDPDHRSTAQMEVFPYLEEGVIFMHEREMSEKELRRVIIHELLHLSMSPLIDTDPSFHEDNAHGIVILEGFVNRMAKLLNRWLPNYKIKDL